MATNKKKTTASGIAGGLGNTTSVGSSKNTTTNSNKSTTNSVTYDANVDYQAKISDAVAKGDYAAAAQYEQQRNAKIDGTGSSYAKTNNYSSYLNNSSGTNSTSKNLVNNASTMYQNSNAGGSGTTNNQYTNYTSLGTYYDAGLSAYAQKKVDEYKAQYDEAKARGDKEGMKAAHDAAEAIRAKYGYSGGADGSDYIALPKTEPMYEYYEDKPTFESKYDPQMEALLNEILNREDFSYDAASDPLYQQYAQMYRREGDRATSNALAEAAASAGGMNSYAITAAQQAGNYYSSQLNDKIPELYQLAYDMYLADKESKVQDLGLLQSMDNTQYNRYRDTMSDWQNDRNFAYNMYRDDVSDSQWNQTFDYNKYVNDRDFAYTSDWANKQWDYQLGRDAINDNRYDTEWNYQVGRDEINDNRYDTEWNYQVGQDTIANNRYDNEWNYKVTQDALGTVRGDQETAKDDVWKYISMGVVPGDDLIAKAGMSKTDVALAVAAVKAEQSKGDSKSTSTNKSTSTSTGDGSTVKKTGQNGEWTSPENLGLGPISDMNLANLVNQGKVIVTFGEDGTLKYKWADGYNKDNYNK